MINQRYKPLVLFTVFLILALFAGLFVRSCVFTHDGANDKEEKEAQYIGISKDSYVVTCELFEKYTQMALEEGDIEAYDFLQLWTQDHILRARLYFTALAMAAKHNHIPAYFDIFDEIEYYRIEQEINWLDSIDSCCLKNCINLNDVKTERPWLDSINRDKAIDYFIIALNSDRSKMDRDGKTWGEIIDKWYKEDDTQQLVVRNIKTGKFERKEESGKRND